MQFANTPRYMDKQCICLHSGDIATSLLSLSLSFQTPHKIDVTLKHYNRRQRNNFCSVFGIIYHVLKFRIVTEVYCKFFKVQNYERFNILPLFIWKEVIQT